VVLEGEPGPASLAAEDTQLLLEHQDLQIIGRLVSAWEDEQAGKYADDQRE
jgi:hypothetical protein